MTVRMLFLCAFVALGLCIPSKSGAQATDNDYVIGIGDIVKLSVYRQQDMETTAAVSNDGAIPVATLGQVKIAGLTAARASVMIADQLKRAGILVNPTVNLMVIEIHSQLVSVLGAVARPGQFPIDRRGVTLGEMLARAGANFTSAGSVIRISGPGGSPESHTAAELLGPLGTRIVHGGDSIIVEAPAMVFVRGEVARPGAYPLEPSTTVDQAIAMAGGLTARGSSHNVRLTRVEERGKSGKPLRARLDDTLKANDVLVVGSRLF